MVHKYFLANEIQSNEIRKAHNYKQVRCDAVIPKDYERESHGHTCGSPFDTENILKNVEFHVDNKNELIHQSILDKTSHYGYAYAKDPQPTFYYYYTNRIKSLFNFIEILIGIDYENNYSMDECYYGNNVLNEFNVSINKIFSEKIFKANEIFKNFVIKKEKDFYSFQVKLVGEEINDTLKPFINVIITDLKTKETEEITIIEYKYKEYRRNTDTDDDCPSKGINSKYTLYFSKKEEIETEINKYIVIPTLTPEHALDSTEVGGRKNITKRSKGKRSKGKRSKGKRSKGKPSKGKLSKTKRSKGKRSKTKRFTLRR